ncbi:MAG: hypothetical protein ACR2N4_12695 [Jatrophihabitans sp.]
MPIREIEAINVARATATGVSEGSVVIGYDSGGHRSLAVVPMSLVDGTAMQKIAFLSGDASNRLAELLGHLQANRGHYTRAVLERLDSASLVSVLSGVEWLGKPLVDQVEPHAVAVTGNFLVLRAPAEDTDPSGVAGLTTWADLLKDRGITSKTQDARLIPIPTGGVFAEAVLGRSNSAEKLDITRFWNWQDSPIPLAPAEIAPVTTGSRGTAEDLTPGPLGPPVLNIQQPTTLPDPSGLGAALGVLASANLFRDMSGLAGTQAAAQAASSGTLDAATAAGQIASTNFQAATRQATEMGQAAADMWKVTKTSDSGSGSSGGSSGGGGIGAGGGASSAGISGDGARINQGRSLDERGVSGAGGAVGAGSRRGGTGAGGAAGAGTSSTTAPDIMPGPPSFSRELAASDESVRVSPDLIGATSDRLGGVDITPASFTVGNPLGAAVGSVVGQGVQKLLIDGYRAAAEARGVSLQGIQLLPMDRHPLAKDLIQADYDAWTASVRYIFLNLEAMASHAAAIAQAAQRPENKGLSDQMAYAVVVLAHEKVHAVQFGQTGRPRSFETMIKYEIAAYGDSATFIQNNGAQLITAHGTDQTFLNKLESIYTDLGTFMQTTQTNETTESDKFEALQEKEMLPAKVGTRKTYPVDSLYPSIP